MQHKNNHMFELQITKLKTKYTNSLSVNNRNITKESGSPKYHLINILSISNVENLVLNCKIKLLK